MTVIWLPQAEQNRRDIGNYIAGENPSAARAMDKIFDSAASNLNMFPKRGRQGVLTGTREIFPHPNYRMVYEIYGDDVFILALVHTAMFWPPEQDA